MSKLKILYLEDAQYDVEIVKEHLEQEKIDFHMIHAENKEEYIKEDTVVYPVSFNGKMRFKISLPATMPKEEVEKAVLSSEEAQKWLENKTPKKVIVVPKRIVNIVT